MKQQSTIPGRLPGLNEMIQMARGNRYSAANDKKDNTQMCAYEAYNQIKPTKGRLNVTVTWYEKDGRRDPDNIHAGLKYILDGLVAISLIDGDSQKYIDHIIHNPIRIDRKNPRIVVELEESNA